MIFHPVKQNTEEPCPCCGKTWMELRAPFITGSKMAKIMAHNGKKCRDGSPKFGDPAHRLAVDIAVVQSGGTATESDYTNAHMERGHEQEPIARMLYEQEYFCTVEGGGFYENGNIGCSPDGRIYDDGLLEVKSVIAHIHYECIKRGDFDPKYKWQLYHNLKVAERDWIDYVSYCATFPRGQQLFVKRVLAKDIQKYFDAMEKRLEDFFVLVERVKNDIRVAA